MRQETKPKNSKSSSSVPMREVFTVDSFANGIAFGSQKIEIGDDPRAELYLRLKDEASVVPIRSRYVLHKNNPLHELELNLMSLSQQGILARSIIYLGTSTDPFHPFDGKFDASMRFLQLFLRYTPGLLVVQTRSPLIVLAMPVLKRLGEHASVTMAIETNSEEVARKYTPNLPKVSERLQAARALRRFGVEVTLQVAPLLPYGDWRAEAGNFAELLVENSDFLSVRPLISKSDLEQRRNAGGTLAKALARDRKFHWLRPDAAIPVIEQIERLAPEKLHMPLRKHLGEKQLNMFAA